jgi:hypothetical protein
MTKPVTLTLTRGRALAMAATLQKEFVTLEFADRLRAQIAPEGVSTFTMTYAEALTLKATIYSATTLLHWAVMFPTPQTKGSATRALRALHLAMEASKAA